MWVGYRVSLTIKMKLSGDRNNSDGLRPMLYISTVGLGGRVKVVPKLMICLPYVETEADAPVLRSLFPKPSSASAASYAKLQSRPPSKPTLLKISNAQLNLSEVNKLSKPRSVKQLKSRAILGKLPKPDLPYTQFSSINLPLSLPTLKILEQARSKSTKRLRNNEYIL